LLILHLHDALEHGFNVIIDKPITLTLEEAKNWKKKLRRRTNFMFDAHLFRLSNGETSSGNDCEEN
jgi:predicted dehydrogenase